MLIDHAGHGLFPSLTWMRMVGRLAFPIFAFMISEGYFHTRDIKRYAVRLCAVALISEIPFDLFNEGLFFDYSARNTCFTLLIGLLVLYFSENMNISWQISKSLVIAAGMIIAELFHTDYGAMGVALIVIFYNLRDKRVKALICMAAINLFYGLLSMAFGYLPLQVLAGAAAVPIYFYNGEKGRPAKYLFYVFYPAHLIIILIIAQLTGLPNLTP